VKPRKPRVLWAFFDCNGQFCHVSLDRGTAVRVAWDCRYEEGGKAVKFVEAPRKAKARKAGRKQ